LKLGGRQGRKYNPSNQQTTMAHSCQARIPTTSFTIPGTTETCHNTTECRKPAAHKITIDDGDAFMPICKECFAKFRTKGLKTGSTWLGWFDCDYPPEARIKGSRWYHETVKKGLATPLPLPDPVSAVAVEELTVKPTLSSAEVDSLVKAMSSLTVTEPKSEKELVKEQIQAIELWMRGEGKLKFKEQPKKLRELLQLRTRFNLLK